MRIAVLQLVPFNKTILHMDTQIKTYFDIVEIIIQSLAIIVGGFWVYFKFIRTRENHPKVQFDLDLLVIGRQDGKIIIELVAIIINKGSVRHWVNDFVCDVLILNKQDKVINGTEEINYQVNFVKANPQKASLENSGKSINRIVWVPKNWYGSFVDPGVEQKYTYLTSIPGDTSFVSLFSRFITKNDYFHSAQRTFSISTLEKNL
jgi:hypothetical protein